MKLTISTLRKIILERLYATIDSDSFDDYNIHASFDVNNVTDLESLKTLNFNTITWDPKDEKYADMLEPGEYNIDDWISDISSIVYIDTKNDIVTGNSQITENDIKKLNIQNKDEFVSTFNSEFRMNKIVYPNVEWSLCTFKGIVYVLFKQIRTPTYSATEEKYISLDSFSISGKMQFYVPKRFDGKEIRKNVPSLVISRLTDALGIDENEIEIEHEF